MKRCLVILFWTVLAGAVLFIVETAVVAALYLMGG